MAKKLFFFFLLFFVGSAYSQNLDISLFDDIPNVGRTAQPLDSVRITPPPAPDIRIDLDNSEPQKAPAPEPTPPPVPSAPISLSNTNSSSPDSPTKPQKKELPRILKDVTTFDISGFSLGEPANNVFQKARQKGFKVTITKEDVPLFYATDYAHKCRQMGYISPQHVSQCVKDYACYEKTRYISEATLVKKNEILNLYFTSNSTGNLLYKIIYINKGDPSLNFTKVNTIKKLTRHKEFWNAVFSKFGNPDDEATYIWGNPQKAYMKAFVTGSSYDAYLIMEDVSLYNDDYYEAADTEEERPPKNTFAF